MIKRVFRIGFFAFVFGLATICHAQFEGKLYYEMSYSTDDKEMLSFIDMLPKESTLMIKKTQMRLDQSLAGGGAQSFITNSAYGTSLLLMRFMGQEFQVKLNEEELLQLELAKKLDIIDGKETKMIAGYKCRQVFAISGTDTLEIYYSPDLKTECVLPQFADLKGIPLQYEIVKGKLRISYLCKSISAETIGEKEFAVDPKTQEIPFKQFAQSFAIAK